MTKEDSILRISLDVLRSRIDVNKKEWINMTTTNCYAYALGLDIPENEICRYAYDPGTIGQSNQPLYIPFSYNTLIRNIIMDLDALKIAYKFISPSNIVDPDSWKIAVFISKNYSLYELEDFHLLRLHNDGFWYHKNGTSGIITNLDYYDQPITDPSSCFSKDYMYTDCLSLTLKLNK